MTFDLSHALNGLRKSIREREDFFTERLNTVFKGSAFNTRTMLVASPARLDIYFDNKNIMRVLYDTPQDSFTYVFLMPYIRDNGYHELIRAQVVAEIRELTVEAKIPPLESILT